MLNKKINYGMDSYLGKPLSCPRTLEEADKERRELREKDKLIALQAMNKELNNQLSINQQKLK